MQHEMEDKFSKSSINSEHAASFAFLHDFVSLEVLEIYKNFVRDLCVSFKKRTKRKED